MNNTEDILNYLKKQLSSYPFHAKTDSAFVAELIHDFQDLDILEETKAFRWYYESELAPTLKNPRLGLRRWLAKAKAWNREHPQTSGLQQLPSKGSSI